MMRWFLIYVSFGFLWEGDVYMNPSPPVIRIFLMLGSGWNFVVPVKIGASCHISFAPPLAVSKDDIGVVRLSIQGREINGCSWLSCVTTNLTNFDREF